MPTLQEMTSDPLWKQLSVDEQRGIITGYVQREASSLSPSDRDTLLQETLDAYTVPTSVSVKQGVGNVLNASGRALEGLGQVIKSPSTYQSIGNEIKGAVTTQMQTTREHPFQSAVANSPLGLGLGAVRGVAMVGQGLAQLAHQLPEVYQTGQSTPVNFKHGLPFQKFSESYPVSSFVGEQLPLALPITRAARAPGLLGKVASTAEAAAIAGAYPADTFEGHVQAAAVGGATAAGIGAVSSAVSKAAKVNPKARLPRLKVEGKIVSPSDALVKEVPVAPTAGVAEHPAGVNTELSSTGLPRLQGEVELMPLGGKEVPKETKVKFSEPKTNVKVVDAPTFVKTKRVARKAEAGHIGLQPGQHGAATDTLSGKLGVDIRSIDELTSKHPKMMDRNARDITVLSEVDPANGTYIEGTANTDRFWNIIQDSISRQTDETAFHRVRDAATRIEPGEINIDGKAIMLSAEEKRIAAFQYLLNKNYVSRVKTYQARARAAANKANATAKTAARAVEPPKLPGGLTADQAAENVKLFGKIVDKDPNVKAYANQIRKELDDIATEAIELGILDKDQLYKDYIPHEVVDYATEFLSRNKLKHEYHGSERNILEDVEYVFKRHLNMMNNEIAWTKAQKAIVEEFGFPVEDASMHIPGYSKMHVDPAKFRKTIADAAKDDATLLGDYYVGETVIDQDIGQHVKQYYVPSQAKLYMEDRLGYILDPASRKIMKVLKATVEPWKALSYVVPKEWRPALEALPGFKQQVTVSLQPNVIGFLARNRVGDFLRVWTLDSKAIKPSTFGDMLTLLKKYESDPYATIEINGKRVSVTELDPYKVNFGQYEADIASTKYSTVMYNSKFGSKPIKAALGVWGVKPALMKVEKLSQNLHNFANRLEYAGRLSATEALIERRGMSGMAAARRASELTVNYTDLSKIERHFLNNALMPFYTWNARTFTDMLWAQTGRFGKGPLMRSWVLGAVLPVGTLMYNETFWPEEAEHIRKYAPWRQFDPIIAKVGDRIITVPLYNLNPASLPGRVLATDQLATVAYYGIDATITGDQSKLEQMGVGLDRYVTNLGMEIATGVNPVGRAIVENQFNKNLFTGAPIYSDSDSVDQKMIKMGKHMLTPTVQAPANVFSAVESVTNPDKDAIQRLGTSVGLFSSTDVTSRASAYLQKRDATEARRAINNKEFIQLESELKSYWKEQDRAIRNHPDYASLNNEGKLRVNELIQHTNAVEGYATSYSEFRKEFKEVDHLYSKHLKEHPELKSALNERATAYTEKERSKLRLYFDEQQMQRRADVAIKVVKANPGNNKAQSELYKKYAWGK